MDVSAFLGNPISFPDLGILVNPDPVAFTILGRDVRWYGVLIGLGIFLALCYMAWRAKHFGLAPTFVLDMILWAMPLGVVCGRIYYCVFYWEQYRHDPLSVLYLWQGGSGMYGVLLGGILALCILGKRRKIPVLTILDLTMLGVMVGQIVGRWGNFFNREAFGGITEIFLKMGLHTASGEVIYVHPTFLYESLWNTLGLVFLHVYTPRRKFDGEIFLLYLAWYGLCRFWLEFLKAESKAIPLFDTGLYTSQVVAAVSFVASTGLLLWAYLKKRPKGEKLYANRIAKQEVSP